MTIAYTPKDAVIDTVAVLLILAPEPATTAIGIALLARPRGKKGQHSTSSHTYHQFPEYHYRVENIRGREITWEVRTIMPGQLPLSQLNKPDVKIKPREQYFYSRTPAAKTTAQSALEKLPPGVKVHHEIYRPSRVPVVGMTKNMYIPGETIHHTLREMPRDAAPDRTQASANIHHTIENSPGYIKSQAGGRPVPQSNITHHSMKDPSAYQNGNPANIVKPVYIKEHHELNKTAPIKINGRLVQPPPAPSRRPTITGR